MIPVPSFGNPFASLTDEHEKMVFKVEKGSEFKFPYNPTTFSIDRGVTWEDAKAMKEPYGVLHFTGGSSDTLNFVTMMDCSEEADESLLKPVKELYALTDVSIPNADKTSKRPPIVKLVWGNLSFVGVITSLKVDFTMFSETGEPVRADITVAMKGRSFSDDDSADKFFAPAGS
jgi:hypothetical protein